ncbi:MAG: hypothetical protein ABIH69_03050 [bacterium]
MKKYLILFLIVVVALGGMGCFEGEAKNTKINEDSPVKLVYTGTNETLSEALYNLDLQDGMLDEPHIVHEILEMDPKSDISDIKKQALMFIGKGGKIEKEEVFESKPSKVIIQITQNGKYALVYSNYTSTGITYSYYDIKGNLLWKEKNTQNEYEVSPDGEIIIEKDYDRAKRLSYYNILNSKKEMIKERFFETDLFEYGQEEEVLFSAKSHYFALRYEGNNKSLVFVFDDKAEMIYKKTIDGYLLDQKGDQLLDDGEYYFLGYETNSFKEKVIVYNRKGEETVSKDFSKKEDLFRLCAVADRVFYALARKCVYYFDCNNRMGKVIYTSNSPPLSDIASLGGKTYMLGEYSTQEGKAGYYVKIFMINGQDVSVIYEGSSPDYAIVDTNNGRLVLSEKYSSQFDEAGTIIVLNNKE